ncbi:hypothetical protein RR48_07210 [Papilio machaon]|uniref:Uncharacterized protein n=1 Tax=Papilio machaon TaxID=76193 RepID=A0A194RNY0_PAPMA|nr:hypothetical protein RR48_07210 [Papilio machaon]
MSKRVCSQTKIRHVNRPYSESDIERPVPPPQPCRRSASSPPLTLTLDSELEDDVFVSPRTNSGSDPFSTTNLEIFRYGSPRTPAGLLLSPRRERSFTFSVTSEKHWRDKGGTDVADGVASADVRRPLVRDQAIIRDVRDGGKRNIVAEKDKNVCKGKGKTSYTGCAFVESVMEIANFEIEERMHYVIPFTFILL